MTDPRPGSLPGSPSSCRCSTRSRNLAPLVAEIARRARRPRLRAPGGRRRQPRRHRCHARAPRRRAAAAAAAAPRPQRRPVGGARHRLRAPRAASCWRRSTATCRTTPRTRRACSPSSSAASTSSPACARAGRTAGCAGSRRASPTACAARVLDDGITRRRLLAQGLPHARRQRLPPFTACTASCPRSPAWKGRGSPSCRSPPAAPLRQSKYDISNRLWRGIADLSASAGCSAAG